MIVESCTGQLSDWEKNIQRMSLPQLLNYLHFLRWRRSSSKTKACKFLGNRSPHAVAAAPFDRQAFWPFFQIDSFPWFDLISAVYLKSTAGFAVTQPFFHHGFHDQLLKFWRVSFVWFSSWHNKSPHLLDSISYCLTNGVQFKTVVQGDFLCGRCWAGRTHTIHRKCLLFH